MSERRVDLPEEAVEATARLMQIEPLESERYSYRFLGARSVVREVEA